VRFDHKEVVLLACFRPETNPFLQLALKIPSWQSVPNPNAPLITQLNRRTFYDKPV